MRKGGTSSAPITFSRLKSFNMIIYIATNSINGMSYIGQTIESLNYRKNRHYKRMRNSNLKFYNALKKYGKDVFIWRILKRCSTKDELNKQEMFAISHHKTKHPNGYNLTNGGNGSLGLKHKKKTKELLSRINSGENHPRFGIPCSEEIKKKIGDANRGRKMSRNFGKQMSRKLKKLWQDKAWRKRQSIAFSKGSQGKRRGRNNGNTKKYIFIDPNNKTHYWDDGFVQFCEIHQLGLNSMRRVLYNKTKKGHHNGWKVKYKYDDLMEA